MIPLIKELYEKANLAKIDSVDENILKTLGFSEEQINNIIQEFVTNQPDKIWKVGDCPRCASCVDSSYPDFDRAWFKCDCRLDFLGSEADNSQAYIRLK